jgi:hypothetical protein
LFAGVPGGFTGGVVDGENAKVKVQKSKCKMEEGRAPRA